MKRMQSVWNFWFLVCCLAHLPAAKISNLEGTTIDAEILKTEPSRIQIRIASGHVLWFEREQLSAETNRMLDAELLAAENAYLKLNEWIGIPLFADDSLWDDATGVVAERLAWPKESETDYQSSYRHYPPADYQILGCRPFSAALFGHEGTIRRLSIVFANKGDFHFSNPPTKDEIKAMKDAIEADTERIEAHLTEALGESDSQQFGSGRGIRQSTQRWNWLGHAFLLASQDSEYVTLKVMPTETADNQGRIERLSDAQLRALTTGNIVTRENGDVLIDNIPMVDQGPKGYCVPATFERYLRYLQIPADMYVLAMAGQTQVGGGTSLQNIIESLKTSISSQNRSMREIKTEIDLRNVRKQIDRGLPMIWTMFSSTEYNQFANERTARRSKTTDWEAWANATKSEARHIQLGKDFMSAHACMIVGYNRETDEIAVSDSWGPRYSERWVPIKLAEQVSQGSIYLIEF